MNKVTKNDKGCKFEKVKLIKIDNNAFFLAKPVKRQIMDEK